MRQQKQQKIYESILSLFRKSNFHSISLVSEDQILQIFNDQAQSVVGEDFPSQILFDIWEQCFDRGEGNVNAVTIAETFVEAMAILQKRVDMLEGKDGLIQDRKTYLSQKRYELSLYENQTQYGNKHIFLLQQSIEQVQKELQELKENRQDFLKQIRLIETILLGDEKLVLQENHKETFLQEEQPRLKQILYINSFLFLIQMFNIQFRLSMFSLVCYLQTYFLLLIGYFYSSSAYHLEIHLFLSIFFDIGYLFVYFSGLFGYQAKSASSLIPTKIVGWILVALILIGLIGRILLMWKWRRFVTITKKSYYFVLWKQKIKLNKRIVRNW